MQYLVAWHFPVIHCMRWAWKCCTSFLGPSTATFSVTYNSPTDCSAGVPISHAPLNAGPAALITQRASTYRTPAVHVRIEAVITSRSFARLGRDGYQILSADITRHQMMRHPGNQHVVSGRRVGGQHSSVKLRRQCAL